MIVDALGNAVAMSLTPGRHPISARPSRCSIKVEPEALIANKAYDANALSGTLEERGIAPVIPSRANRIVQRPTDFAHCRERNLVERFFGKLKGFRAIATHYDKLASTFLAAIQLVSALFLAQLTTRPKAFRQGSRPWCRTRAAIEDFSALSQGSLTLADVPPIS